MLGLITAVFLGTVGTFTYVNNNDIQGISALKYTLLPSIAGVVINMVLHDVLNSAGIKGATFILKLYTLFLAFNIVMILVSAMTTIDLSPPMGNAILYIVILLLWGLEFNVYLKLLQSAAEVNAA